MSKIVTRIPCPAGHDSQTYVIYENNEKYCFNASCAYSLFQCPDCAIIGNIYENSELLEE